MIPIETILKDFGEKLVNDLRAALKAKNVGYGGQDSKLATKIRFRVIPKDNSISFHLLMPDYWEFVDRGRPKTKEKGGTSKTKKKGGTSKTKKKGEGSVTDKIGEWARAKNLVGKYQENELYERQKKQIASKQRARNFSKESKRERAKRKWKTLKKMPFDRAKKQLAFAIASKIHKKGYEGNNFFTDTINDGRLDILATDLKDYGLHNLNFDVLFKKKKKIEILI